LAVVDACVYITSAYFFIVFFIICLPARSTLFPYTTLFRSDGESVSLVHDIYLGPNSSSAGLYGFAEFNGALYFTAYDPDNGHERSEERRVGKEGRCRSSRTDCVRGKGVSLKLVVIKQC